MRPEHELMKHSRVLRSLVLLAEQIRSAAENIATHVENIAWELDREQRGALSAAARQDAVEVANTIEQLLEEPLLNDVLRKDVRERIRAKLDELDGPPPAAPPVPAAQAVKPQRKARGSKR